MNKGYNSLNISNGIGIIDWDELFILRIGLNSDVTKFIRGKCNSFSFTSNAESKSLSKCDFYTRNSDSIYNTSSFLTYR